MEKYILTLTPEAAFYTFALYAVGFAACVFILRVAFGINRLLKRIKANNELLSLLAKSAGADPTEIEKILNHAEGNV